MNQTNISTYGLGRGHLERHLRVRRLLRVAHAAGVLRLASARRTRSPRSARGGGTTSRATSPNWSSRVIVTFGYATFCARAEARGRSGTGASPRRRTEASGSPARAGARTSPARPSRCLPVGLVAAAVRGLADRDVGERVARLDALVGGHVELRVDRRADDLRAVELRRQEQLEVRLVPDRAARHRRRSRRACRCSAPRACARSASGCSGSSAGRFGVLPPFAHFGVPRDRDHAPAGRSAAPCARARRGRSAGTRGRRRSSG